MRVAESFQTGTAQSAAGAEVEGILMRIALVLCCLALLTCPLFAGDKVKVKPEDLERILPLIQDQEIDREAAAVAFVTAVKAYRPQAIVGMRESITLTVEQLKKANSRDRKTELQEELAQQRKTLKLLDHTQDVRLLSIPELPSNGKVGSIGVIYDCDLIKILGPDDMLLAYGLTVSRSVPLVRGEPASGAITVGGGFAGHLWVTRFPTKGVARNAPPTLYNSVLYVVETRTHELGQEAISYPVARPLFTVKELRVAAEKDSTNNKRR
ncbi:MAG: hypothetical protein K1X74_19820 [Pirellulales bacterium]|nr:hypothetical protein [Pirellulales bacterium]